MDTIGKRLTLAMARVGIDDNELDRAIGLVPEGQKRGAGYTSRLTRDLRKNPHVGHVRKMAEALGVNFEWLYEGRGPMELTDGLVKEIDHVEMAIKAQYLSLDLAIRDDVAARVRAMRLPLSIAVEDAMRIIKAVEHDIKSAANREKNTEIAAQKLRDKRIEQADVAPTAQPSTALKIA